MAALHTVTWPAGSDSCEAPLESPELDAASPAVHAVDVAVQTDLPISSLLVQERRDSGSASKQSRPTSAESKPPLDAGAVPPPLSLHDTAASDVRQQRADSSDALVAQHSQDSQKQQQQGCQTRLQDDANSNTAQHSMHTAASLDQRAKRDRKGSAQETRTSQHVRRDVAAQHSTFEQSAAGQRDSLQEEIIATQGRRVGEEVRQKAEAQWTQGLQLPQQLSVSILAKHAGVDKAFMQVCAQLFEA